MQLDYRGYPTKHPATEEDQRAEMQRYFAKRNQSPAYEQCGICGAYHPNGYMGDCRNDLYRIADPDELHGAGAWQEIEP